MSKKLELAKTLAAFAHQDQKYSKRDYFESHIMDVVDRVTLEVASMSECDQEHYIIVAYLHDVFEDADIDISLVESLFGDEIGNSVWLLSKSHCYRDMNFDLVRTSKKDYLEYISDIKQDPTALLVKICDTEANLDASISDGNEKRTNKYTTQWELLNK